MEKNNKPIVRFAPSPTGNIHIGNARPALFNWLFAKQNNGTFILRFDDTDTVRSKVEYAENIARDLDWLGIKPDRVERQSERIISYDSAAEVLKKAGVLYACYETADEIDRKRKRLMARGLPPIYDRTGLKLSDEDRAKLEAEGRKPHWRFMLPNYLDDPFNTSRTEIAWDDLIRGHQIVDLASLSDPVLVREDGTYLYTLPSVVDDIDMGVTHVIRGDDHVTNTGTQIAVFQALGATAPVFGHHNLLISADGEGLSKRLGSLSIASLRENGVEPMAVATLASVIGTSKSVEPCSNMNALLNLFDLSTVTKSAARFDPVELDNLSAKLVHNLEYRDVSNRLADLGVDQDENFWLVVRGNLQKIADARQWHDIVEGDYKPVIENSSDPIWAAARNLFPNGEFDQDTWKIWTTAIKQETGLKGRALFMPLRQALTGLDHGPELAALLPIIGREKTLRRLP
jgi:glutamyl-tRNA synthetase